MHTVIALGTFDGMHLGHRTVISRAVEEAKRSDAKAIVYTFSSIPRALYSIAPIMLMSPDERMSEMLKMGVDEVVMADFTDEIARMSPEDFVRMLAKDYHMCCVVAGEDYTFGYMAKGNMALMKEMGKKLGFRVVTVESVRVKMPDGRWGNKISSTDIRKAISKNKQELARHLANGEYE